ncbi:hypothetical protein [Spirabiliibacterium falconis]|uniref:hypothetical protein n=1 Tax=Spirabiliibacterium falconis TaxID=572023 RepID=UPI001AADD896|nr:hypothetical protein [Spirabiliibacterium falconis]MBE2893676.1 hypothetical protein [Spirabiliibacterium falconis]
MEKEFEYDEEKYRKCLNILLKHGNKLLNDKRFLATDHEEAYGPKKRDKHERSKEKSQR